MSFVAFFDQPEAAVGHISGGKGANLIALSVAGFDVPEGFVVTAAAYREFLANMPWIEESIAQFNYQEPARLEEQCILLRQRLCQMPLPETVAQEIRAAIRRLGDAPVAVRSSSTFEDLANAAFAGQHDTYLNIRGEAHILDRVRACFASLWESRAVLYRHHQGFVHRDAQMAVVVQRQIACDAAGVAFSIDPVGGRMDRIIVDGAYGIGESVVSGDGEVDHFEIEKSTLAILQRSIGNKQTQVVPGGDSVERKPVPAELAERPCLNDAQIADVARLARRVEEHYGWPQDIEWGIAGNVLHLLQARPVTTIQADWTRDESAERFPNPMTPLSWDFINVAFGASLTHSLALMGLPPLKGDWFRIFDHYIYGNQNAGRLLAMFRPLRARSVPELVEEIPSLRRRFAWVMDLPVNWARDLDRYLLRLGRLDSRPTPDTLPAAWAFMSEVLNVAQDYFQPNIAISMTQSGLHRLLHAMVAMLVGPERALAVVDGLLTGCETKTATVNREIHALAVLATQDQPLRDALLKLDGKQCIETGLLQQHPAFAARFDRFLEDHGHREMDMDYSQPTWSGQPWVVLDSIVLLMRAGINESPADSLRTQRLRYAATERQLLAGAPEAIEFFLRELIRLARTYTMLDDLEHYQTTRINPLARRAALGMGRILRGMGALEADGDVFYLNKTDLEEVVANPKPEAIALCREKATRAKASYAAASRQAPPWSRSQRDIPPAAGTDNLLLGLPGSPGIATGAAFCVHGPADFARFPKGAVLVARTTNPAWTPLFYAASAVVTESGGPLSHGAVTAREMGLPAVMSVRGVMRIVNDGQELTVDGTRGSVALR